MTKPVPKHLAQIYGGATAFRRHRRYVARRIEVLIQELRRGSAFYPCGSDPVSQMDKLVKDVRKALSTRTWGR